MQMNQIKWELCYKTVTLSSTINADYPFSILLAVYLNIAYMEITAYPVIVTEKCATKQQVEVHEIILLMN